MAGVERRSISQPGGEARPFRGVRTPGEHIETDFARFHRRRTMPLEVMEGDRVDRNNGHMVVKLRPDPENPQDGFLFGMKEPVILYKKGD